MLCGEGNPIMHCNELADKVRRSEMILIRDEPETEFRVRKGNDLHYGTAKGNKYKME